MGASGKMAISGSQAGSDAFSGLSGGDAALHTDEGSARRVEFGPDSRHDNGLPPEPDRIRPLLKIARGLSSPAILISVVWCVTLLAVAVGPVVLPGQPSVAVLVLVAVGVSLFMVACGAGTWCFHSWLQFQPSLPAPSVGTLNIAVVTTSILGLAGIALIALDRIVLSGVSNNGYAELARCWPVLVDFIEIKRTPVVYAGYLIFSFGSASLVMFLLKGEEIRGWAAILAQLSILSPVGYALLYAGRMPILLAIVLAIAAVLVRIGQGRRPLPQGHHLLIKAAAVLVLFGIYTNAMWSSRREFCTQMSGLILELQEKAQEAERMRGQPGQPQSGAISATDLSKMIDATKALPGGGEGRYSPDVGPLMVTKQEVWHTSARAYVLWAIESGWLSPGAASNLLNTYFYPTHGIYVLDVVWHARAQFSPHWGIYEIGVLSPVLRIFLPQNRQLLSMTTELEAEKIFNSFPTVWAAAYIDFGAAGAVIYILIWGFAAGWSAFGSRHSGLAMPPLLLTFILASILMSSVQGPLGIANSALILVSMAIVGIAIDFGSLRFRQRRAASGSV
jgi:hypothetical protein